MAPVPSWDLFITIYFIIGLAYGFMLQRERVVVTLFSTFVGLIVVQALGGTVQSFFQGDATLFNQLFVKANATPFTVQTLIFLGTIVALTAKSGISGGRSSMFLSPLELFGYSFLVTGLILVSILFFLPPEQRESLIAASKLANLIVHYRLWWILAPVALLIVTGLRRGMSIHTMPRV